MLFLAEKNGGRGVAGGNDGDDFWGVMTFRRYESNRCQEEVIRSKTTYMIYILYINIIYIWELGKTPRCLESC